MGLSRRYWMMLAALGGFVSIAVGAFAAHGVADPAHKEWLKTGAQYGFMHTMATFACATFMQIGARRARFAPAFFLPGVVAMTYAGWVYFQESLAIRETTFNADPIPVYPFKFFIPFAGAILLLQGLVEIARCVICIREGAWPSREQDVEEVDVDKLKAMVHADEHPELAAPPAERGGGPL